MIPVLDSRRMRAADAAAIRGGIPSRRLMENAAEGVAGQLVAAFPESRDVVAVCGPGNNGGDGLAAARLLSGRGITVSVFTLSDPDSYRGDAAGNASRAREAGLELTPLSGRGAMAAFARRLKTARAVVDALFGTGLTRALSGSAARAVSAINSAGRPVVAADLPSGLSSDTGQLTGPCVKATLTVALAALKPAHVFWPARAFCGRTVVHDIGIPRRVLAAPRSLSVVEAADVRRWLPPRAADSHKADFGRLAVIAGSRGKSGAAVLTARGALRGGAGLVTVFCPASIESIIVAALPEAMTRGLPEEDGALAGQAAEELFDSLRGFDAAVAGPGLGTRKGTVELVERLLSARCPLVCDADALNAFAGRPRAFSRRRGRTVLTPHPGEAARLLATTGREIQKDRLASARRLSQASRAVVLLKGAGSLTFSPSGSATLNPTGTPLMSTAGSGDVLAGVLGALLAGGLDPERAAIAAAYLHGAAGERLEERLGDAGLLAGDLADELPMARAALPGGPKNWKRETGKD